MGVTRLNENKGGGKESGRSGVKAEVALAETSVLIAKFECSSMLLVNTNFVPAARTTDSPYVVHCLELTLDSVRDALALESM